MKYILLLILTIGAIYAKSSYVQPNDRLVEVQKAQAQEAKVVPHREDPVPSLSEILSEIAREFEPEGKAVVVKAINCFYSESGLRYNALHKNTNGTYDGGVAQINDVHKMTIPERMDYKKNIKKAHEIYKSRKNFSAWYAQGCR